MYTSSVVLPVSSFTTVKLCDVVPEFVTLSVACCGAVELGTVIEVSLRVTSATPSCGGLKLDFDPLTSNTLTIPCVMCGWPSPAAGTKHMMP